MCLWRRQTITDRLPSLEAGRLFGAARRHDRDSMTAPYSPVIDQGNFIVLGMLPQSFTPVSYQENKDVVFTVKGTSFQECAAVYTGLKFTDPVYNSTYLVLMKVNKKP